MNRLALISFTFLLFLLPQNAHADADADEAWLQDHFDSVYKTSRKMGSAVGKLALELDLLDDTEKGQLLVALRTRLNKPDYQLKEVGLDTKAVAERVLAGLRFLETQKLVLVESSAVADLGVWEGSSRTGVMSQKDFEALYPDGVKNNTGEVFPAFYTLDEETILIDSTYVELLNYLEFSLRYNAEQNRWEPKNDRWESIENAIYRHTETVLKEITDFNPNYLNAAKVRAFVSNNLKKIPKMNVIDPNLRIRSIPLAVEQVITGYNIALLREEATKEDDRLPAEVKTLLAKSFTDTSVWQDLIAFEQTQGNQLNLVHGHFCTRKYVKDHP